MEILYQLEEKSPKQVHDLLHMDIKEQRQLLEKYMDYCKTQFREIWGFEYRGYLRVNGQLKRTRARACLSRYGTGIDRAKGIEIGRETFALYSKYDPEALERILLHELAHLALGVQGRNFNDGSSDFENELRKINSVSSGATKVNNRGAEVGTQLRAEDLVVLKRDDEVSDIFPIKHVEHVDTKHLYSIPDECITGYMEVVGFRIVKC